MKKILSILLFSFMSGCVNYPADNALEITGNQTALDMSAEKRSVVKSIEKIYKAMDLPKERSISIGNLEDYEFQQESRDMKTSCDNKVIAVSSGSINAAHCSNSILIAKGNIEVSHSSNNIIISGGSVKISFDGMMGGGSIIISNRDVEISHAMGTTVYAVGGLKISHSNNVAAFNTENRELSWGHANNIKIKPLFKNEPVL